MKNRPPQDHLPLEVAKKPLKPVINWIITVLQFHGKSNRPFFPLEKIIKIIAIPGHHALRAHRNIGLARV